MLEILIAKFVPGFREHWEKEDVYREEDGSFTEHGVMGSFLEYYKNSFDEISTLELSTLCVELERIVASGADDNDPSANAICTMFLEILVGTPAGNKIERYLGKECKKFWNQWKT